MLWGSGTGALEVIILNGVAVVPGPSAKAWRETLPAGVWTAEQVDQAWSVLTEDVERSPCATERRLALLKQW